MLYSPCAFTYSDVLRAAFIWFFLQAGSAISSVSLFVVNLYGPAHTVEMIPPDSQRARYTSLMHPIST